MIGFRTSINGVYGGSQIQEAFGINLKHQQALERNNYPHVDGVHDIPLKSCLGMGITNCLDCYNKAYPPCLEVSYGKPKYNSP